MNVCKWREIVDFSKDFISEALDEDWNSWKYRAQQ